MVILSITSICPIKGDIQFPWRLSNIRMSCPDTKRAAPFVTTNNESPSSNCLDVYLWNPHFSNYVLIEGFHIIYSWVYTWSCMVKILHQNTWHPPCSLLDNICAILVNQYHIEALQSISCSWSYHRRYRDMGAKLSTKWNNNFLILPLAEGSVCTGFGSCCVCHHRYGAIIMWGL